MDKIEKAQLDIADSIGMDIIYAQPPDERHFDPVSILFSFAGLLIIDFSKGFFAEVRERSYDAGKSVADKLFNSGKNILSKHPNEQKEEVMKAVYEMKAEKDKITEEGEIQRVTKIAQTVVENVLLKNNFPPNKAAELAQQVTNKILEIAF